MLSANAKRVAPRMVFGSHDFQEDSHASLGMTCEFPFTPFFSTSLRGAERRGNLARAALYVKITPASTHGKYAIACILVLWPTWMICMLYEQNAMAMAPATAINLLVPIESISRKPPMRAISR